MSTLQIILLAGLIGFVLGILFTIISMRTDADGTVEIAAHPDDPKKPAVIIHTCRSIDAIQHKGYLYLKYKKNEEF